MSNKLDKLPYRKLRPEQQLMRDLHGLLTGDKYKVGDAWLKHTGSIYKHKYDGSDNWSQLSASVDWLLSGDYGAWNYLRQMYSVWGHHLGELGSCNYSHYSVMAEAASLDNPAAFILLQRDVLLWQTAARETVIRHPKRGRVEYSGQAARVAGLRSTANHWDNISLHYLMSRIHNRRYYISRQWLKQNRQWVEMCDAVVPEVRRRFVDVLIPDSEIVEGLTSPLGMTYNIARHTPTNRVFSWMTGRRVGYNTGATWAVHAKSAGDTDRLYPWLNGKLTPLKRVRTGKLRRAGKVKATKGEHVISVVHNLGEYAKYIPQWVKNNVDVTTLTVDERGGRSV